MFLRLRLHFTRVNRGDAKVNANADTKQTTSWRSIGSRPPRGSEVDKKMAASISDEKLADSVRRYPVLYDKSCAVFKNKSKKRKKKCLERCSMQKMRYFWVRLLRPLSILYSNTTKSRLIATKASLSSAILEKRNFDCAWLRLRILPSLHLRSTCERRLRLHLLLHLRRMCEPGFKVGLMEMCYTSPLFPRLTIHLVSPSDIPNWILTRILLPVWTTLSCRSLIAWPPPTKDHTSPLDEYCRLVTAHTAPRRRYKDTIKKALSACSIVPKHWTPTAAYRNAWWRLTTHQKTESATLEPFWNLESNKKEFRIQYLKSRTYSMESKIQYCLGISCMRQTTCQHAGAQHPSNLTLKSGSSILLLEGNLVGFSLAPTKTCGRHFNVYSHQLLGQANFYEVF